MAALASTTTRTDRSIREELVHEIEFDPKIASKDLAVAVKNRRCYTMQVGSSYWELTTPRSVSTE